MTENKLKKYFKIPLPPQTCVVNKTTKHIVLSDSKAGYLRSYSSDASEYADIVWWYKPGARTEEQTRFAEWKLRREVDRSDSMNLQPMLLARNV